MSTKHKSAWSEWAWDAGRNQWGRYRLSRGEYEYEWRDPEASTSSTSNPEASITTAWSEWEWQEDRKKWRRYRLVKGEYEYEWRDPEASTSSTSSTTTAWSEWEWQEDRKKWRRYRLVKGEYEYEWRDSEASTSSTSKPEEKKEKKGKLSVALYRPRWGNLHHWALHLDIGNYLYEVTGEAMNFTAECKSNLIPSSSGSWTESITVAEIQPADMAELHKIITGTPVQNDVQGWCCQDYVMEALEGLNKEQIVDDEDYEKVKKRLMKKFNH